VATTGSRRPLLEKNVSPGFVARRQYEYVSCAWRNVNRSGAIVPKYNVPIESEPTNLRL
jgi:hypothetical protein